MGCITRSRVVEYSIVNHDEFAEFCRRHGADPSDPTTNLEKQIADCGRLLRCQGDDFGRFLIHVVVRKLSGIQILAFGAEIGEIYF